MEVSKRLAEFIVGLRYEQLPEPVIHAFKRSLLDYLCVSVAGSQMDISRRVREYFQSLDANGASSVIGTSVSPAPRA